MKRENIKTIVKNPLRYMNNSPPSLSLKTFNEFHIAQNTDKEHINQ